MAKTIAETLVATLEQLEVKQIFGLIGDSLNGFADAVRHSSIEWIGVRHEEGAALAAAGQAKLTGNLGVCCATTGPGSTHLVAGLYEAQRDHAPVLAISGDMPRKLQGLDYIQATNPNLLFRDVALFTETISTPEQAPGLIHQAIASAYSGRGVTHLTIPQDIMAAKAIANIPSVETLRKRPEFSPSTQSIVEVVRQIDQADSIVIMCGAGCHGLSDDLRTLSQKLHAPLIHSVKGKEIMAYDDPQWMGGIGMIGTKAVYNAVMSCELFIMIGTDYPYSEYLPQHCKVIQIDDRPEVLGRRTPTMLGVAGSARPSLELLLKHVAQKSNSKFFDQVTVERKKWDELLDKQSDLARSKDVIHPQAVARLTSDLASSDAVFVFDTGLNTLWSGNWIRQRGRQRIIGSFNNAAVGTSVGHANGVQALDRKRQVIALCGDGGFNMLLSEFLTAVHHKLPVKVIIYNNSSFGLIKLEAESVGLASYDHGIQFPNPDYAALARACGAHGFTAKKPNELHGAISEALAVDGPAIVDAVVAANEIPNVPHLDLKVLGNMGIAKLKEVLNLVTGY